MRKSAISALIVDDEHFGRQYIRSLLASDPRFRVVEMCKNGRQAIAVVQQRPVDVMFLDVRMPNIDGFGVINACGARHPLIVLVTAFSHHAARAFESEVFDYVTKPIDPARFANVLDRVCLRLDELAKLEPIDGTSADEVHNAPAGDTIVDDKLGISAVKQDVLCDVDQIRYLEAASNYVKMAINGEVVLVRATLEQLQQQLDPTVFVQVHRSFIVSMKWVKRLRYHRSGAGELEIADGTIIPVSRSRRKLIAELLQAQIRPRPS